MIGLLTGILGGVELTGTMVVFGIEVAVNAILAAIGVAVVALFALLPSMGPAPSFSSSTWLSWLNWFYPVSALVAVFTSAVTVWIAFLAVRWMLRLWRAV